MCNYCLKDICPPGCPNYEEPTFLKRCDICKEGIFNGEEYIENDDGDCRHYDCFQGVKDMLQWLGYEIKKMEG